MPDTPDPRGPACAEWDEDLSALIDGELAPEREAQVRAHVAGCDRCEARLATLGRVDALLAATPLPEVPDRVRAAVAEGVQREVAEPAHPVRRAPPARRRWLSRPALGVAVAAAAALALYLALRPPPETAPATPPPVPVAVEEPGPAPPDAPDSPELSGPPPTEIGLAPVPDVPPVPAPAPEVAPFEPELQPLDPLVADLDAEPEEDLALVLLGVEESEDFDVIANLELLERMLELEAGRG